ncbi:hypothetical protein PIB30_071324 [Stylosanthes scabra]|uniref:DUF3475 domain-containing protein n=1 Tax=Stylosanthes scabra TaxID=79078 RepID=A0ABU6ZMD9_9FABA|nr:hypothetical protein [Stylosanthes scabra]
MEEEEPVVNADDNNCFKVEEDERCLLRIQRRDAQQPSAFAPISAARFIHWGSFLGRASEKAVDVLDTLGSDMPAGLSLEWLLELLSEENIQFLRKEILQSGVQQLVSTDLTELINLTEAPFGGLKKKRNHYDERFSSFKEQ